MSDRFYVGKKAPADLADDLEEWITDRIPPVSGGLRCESDFCNGQDWNDEFDEDGTALRPIATTFVYRIDDKHICYTYVCDDCGERASDSYIADVDAVPTTSSGYAVTPKHCS